MEVRKTKNQSGSPYDLGPFSCINEMERHFSTVNKLATRLKKFCDENRNVHQPIKALAVELQDAVKCFKPSLSRLRKSTAAVDRELMDLSLSEKMKRYEESKGWATSTPAKVLKSTSDVTTQTPGAIRTNAAVQTEAQMEVHTPPPPLPQRGESWKEVATRSSKRKSAEAPGTKEPTAPSRTPKPIPVRMKKITRPRKDAILVEVSENSSAEKKTAVASAAEFLKTKVNLGDHESFHPKLRVTRAGDLIIEAGSGQTANCPL